MDGRPPLFSPDALGRNALAYQRTLLEAGAPRVDGAHELTNAWCPRMFLTLRVVPYKRLSGWS